MPATGRAACEHEHRVRSTSSRAAPPALASQRNEKAQSVQAMQPPRRESAQASAGATQQRPGLKNRAYSAPMIPKNHADGTEHDQEEEEIADDPFFQRYNFPRRRTRATRKLRRAPSTAPPTPRGLSRPPISARASRTRCPVPSRPRILQSGNSESATTMQDINIAILGARGAGKSSFIQRALHLPGVPSSAVSTRKMTIDGAVYIVRFLELCFSDVKLGDRNSINWPETLDGLSSPRVDGAVTVYDVTNHSSLAHVPEMLDAIARASLPFLLVACKCDAPHMQVQPDTVEQKAKAFLGDLTAFQATEDSADVYRSCVSVITRAVIAAKRPRSQASTRPRANSSAVRHVTPREPFGQKGHGRASSEFSVSSRPYRRSGEEKGRSRYHSSDTPGHTFLDLEESPGYDSNDSDAQASDDEQSIVSEQPSNERGYTFDQLVDRLLAQPMSKNDSKFVAIYLALYRRFAAPSQLLGAILKRFEALTKDRNPQVICVISQLRYLAVLQQWVSSYPGDFAYRTTARTIRKFAQGLATNKEFAVAAKEILHDLELVQEDDDTDWACNDRQRYQTEPALTFHTVLDEDSEDDEFARAIGHLSVSSTDRLSMARSINTITTNTSRTTQSSTASGSSSQTWVHQVEMNQKLAKQLEPNPIKPLSKVQWHQLMVESDDAIARELTRIDWIMFSSIRPRDLVRHVSMNAEEKKRCKSLENVNRMIDHFNHVAYLVTNYILLRDKPKHRALMLEKWMMVARAVRKLNNYNALGAVLAGIKGTAVHRLLATRDLVPQTTARDFMKLEILMGTQKSYSAYRLAWENTSMYRIPYIPLHRRDLVSASEGNSTFVGDKKPAPAFTPHPGVSVFQGAAGNRDSREAPPGGVVGKERINWRKFEIMGEVIVGVQQAQGTPYSTTTLARNDSIRNLLLDVQISKDDDELYDRSVQLEAAGAGERPRFNWFRQR
ncbi:ras guanine nucleotide exchange factor domain-containing protein [Clohesyomyces aquaticus]|uniref:Ras guanine nucleotide exchange factor domain-containing protein n=1 Tax=Clohesyomyces aquaticus TaxID=1231657 RepID=A0A1Y2A9U3_9PLEO|nr:ras guanine nucleotide exchange factor domain-containing protein [Clohesyomyces aquaticus]